MANEVATTKKFELVTIEGDLAEAIAEEMDGLGTIPYDRVKIPSGGSIAFEIPTENEDEPESTKEIVGVILDHHNVNSHWLEAYNGSDQKPICSSYDGHNGVEDTGEMKNCDNCPYNQFGSGEDGKGKACKNSHRLYILRQGNPIPLVLTLPPTSIKFARDYFAKSIVLKGMRCYDAVTKITLKKDKSAGGIDYSRACFSFVSKLDPEQAAAAKSMAALVTDMKQKINDAEITEESKPAADNDGFMNVPEEINEALPFN